MTGVRALDHSCQITLAFGTFANQQQVPALDRSAEVGDRHLVAAISIPDIGQQAANECPPGWIPTADGPVG